jgi:surface protein
MFSRTGYNNPNFTLDVSTFDTSNVNDMSHMFAQTGFNSIKLNTSITIRNPSINSYRYMFNDVATKDDSKITVNYTSETSALVDSMIATKSYNSNVIKGVNVDLISFNIDGTTYQAEKDMTWEQWISSEYCTNKKIDIKYGGVVLKDVEDSSSYNVVGNLFEGWTDESVSSSDVIQEGKRYEFWSM